MSNFDKIVSMEVSERMLTAARNATRICLGTTSDDRAIIIFDSSTENIAAALCRSFTEIHAKVEAINLDDSKRPLLHLPGAIAKKLGSATVSATAIASMQGELSMRREILETVTGSKIKHVHMPSITDAIFEDAVSMDYRKVATFIDQLVKYLHKATSLTMTSAGGTNLEISYNQKKICQLDGIVTKDRWQNLPSGQIVIAPFDANGVFVVDKAIGDWFEQKYTVSDYPVTLEFERGFVRKLSCDNKRLERELGLFLRSSDNSGRISELVIGANLELSGDHKEAIFVGYCPSASIGLGTFPSDTAMDWTAATFLPLTGQKTNITVANQRIMTADVLSDQIITKTGLDG